MRLCESEPNFDGCVRGIRGHNLAASGCRGLGVGDAPVDINLTPSLFFACSSSLARCRCQHASNRRGKAALNNAVSTPGCSAQRIYLPMTHEHVGSKPNERHAEACILSNIALDAKMMPPSVASAAKILMS